MPPPGARSPSCSKHTGRGVDDSRGHVRQRVHGTHTTRNDGAVEGLRRPVFPVARHVLQVETRVPHGHDVLLKLFESFIYHNVYCSNGSW